MLIKVNPGSGVPMYRQIMEQVRRAAVTGAIEPNSKLPSVRELSQRLEISPITIVKAYTELEHLGIVETRRGKGTFISPDVEIMTREDRLHAAEEILEGVAEALSDLGLPAETVIGILRLKLRRSEPVYAGRIDNG